MRKVPWFIVFQTRDATIAVVSAAWPKQAGPASLAVAIVNLHQVSCGRRMIAGFETLPGRTQIGVAGRIVAELVLAEQTLADGSPPLRPGNMGHDAGLFAGLNVLDLVCSNPHRQRHRSDQRPGPPRRLVRSAPEDRHPEPDCSPPAR